jgi:YD repeat-containing protein
MASTATAIASIALALAATIAHAADPARLAKDEVKATLADKTLVYTAPNGSPQRVYYAADGRLTGKAANNTGKSSQSVGEWTVEDDGKVCQKIRQGPMTDRCYYVMRGDAGLSIGASGKGIPVTLE